ncbi:MAG TPA: hypothetical protein VIO33_06390 [Burkholderiaceae bacterium]
MRKPDWEWADVDRDRLVRADRGRLYAGRAEAGGLSREKLLHDFNATVFERRAAPY